MKTFRFYAFNTESFFARGTVDEAGAYREKLNKLRESSHYLFEEVPECAAEGCEVRDLEYEIELSE